MNGCEGGGGGSFFQAISKYYKGLNLGGVYAILISAAGFDCCGSALAAAVVFSLHTTYRLFLSNVEMVQIVEYVECCTNSICSGLYLMLSRSCEKSTDIFCSMSCSIYGYLGVIVENKGPDSLTDQDRCSQNA